MSTAFAQCAYWTAVPWPPAVASLDRRVDQLRRLGLPAAERREHERAVRRDARPGRLRDRVGLGDQRRCRREVAAQRDGLAEDVERRPRGPRARRRRGRARPARVATAAAARRGPRRTTAAAVASQPQREHLLRRDSGAGERASAARCSTGAAAARPSVNTSAKPSSSRSRGRGGAAAARRAPARPGRRRAGCRALASRPANSAAPHASR